MGVGGWRKISVFISKLNFILIILNRLLQKQLEAFFGVFGRNPEKTLLDLNLDSKTKEINYSRHICI